ncbi:type II toxin-antitoxin system RelE family toxin [Methylogaea oryzae]|uniref:type II toxin-antitoxin system RelE family toxin n=1 Tax=Methylogaea oryzae TaxID=1295382 RepID=UPI001C3F3A31|nr:type II toxin-antitoxin system RelE/ParE family toxin [Methylogaea oryzae]
MKELSVAERVRIVQAIDGLKTNPHPHGAVKLSGGQGLYRLRSGDYRVIYRIENAELLVLVVKVGHRREVYR